MATATRRLKEKPKLKPLYPDANGVYHTPSDVKYRRRKVVTVTNRYPIYMLEISYKTGEIVPHLGEWFITKTEANQAASAMQIERYDNPGDLLDRVRVRRVAGVKFSD